MEFPAIMTLSNLENVKSPLCHFIFSFLPVFFRLILIHVQDSKSNDRFIVRK